MRDAAPGRDATYEAPEITLIGSVYELTQYCDKHLNGSDGFTFMGQPITCVS